MSKFKRNMNQDDEKLNSVDFHCLNDKTNTKRESRLGKIWNPQICRKAVRTIQPPKFMHSWEDNIDTLHKEGDLRFANSRLQAIILSSCKKENYETLGYHKRREMCWLTEICWLLNNRFVSYNLFFSTPGFFKY